MRAFASARLEQLGPESHRGWADFLRVGSLSPDGADGEPDKAFKGIRFVTYNSQHPSRGAQRLRWTYGHPPLNSFPTWYSRIIPL